MPRERERRWLADLRRCHWQSASLHPPCFSDGGSAPDRLCPRCVLRRTTCSQAMCPCGPNCCTSTCFTLPDPLRDCAPFASEESQTHLDVDWHASTLTHLCNSRSYTSCPVLTHFSSAMYDSARSKHTGSPRRGLLRFLAATPVAVSVHLDSVCTLLPHNHPSRFTLKTSALGSLHVHQTVLEPTSFSTLPASHERCMDCQGTEKSNSQLPIEIVKGETCSWRDYVLLLCWLQVELLAHLLLKT